MSDFFAFLVHFRLTLETGRSAAVDYGKRWHRSCRRRKKGWKSGKTGGMKLKKQKTGEHV